ncbi:DUF3368 domain-containing protein [Neolewinella sp.]|uniref:DUF3368 domain-containing protein n=1 Tax=Neolewinella sp. TaxID=2993543 RepID=UPI003B52E7B9
MRLVVAEFGVIPGWIAVITEYNQKVCCKLMQDLGPGESSCIAIALGQERPLLTIDDRQAKKIAEKLGVECIGSLGVLLIAKQQGVFAEVGSILQQIQLTDFRVSHQLLDKVRRLAGEA